jgi:hypothetical protein
MTISNETLENEPTLQAVVDSLGRFECFNDEHYDIDETGENNQVLVGQQTIVKVPREQAYRAAQASLVETLTVCALNETTLVSPLAIPRAIHLNNLRRPYYAVRTMVPGTVMDQDVLNNFTMEEKHDFGAALGGFIAWMGQAMSLETYAEIVNTRNIEVFDRAAHIRYMVARATYDDYLPELLRETLFSVYDELRLRKQDGSITPVIIGHDDLRVTNETFARRTGKWALNGIFDFGLTKPSGPERELRHIALLGPDALEPAIEVYEAATDTRLSRELISFWAIAQTSTACAGWLWSGKIEIAKRRYVELERLLSTSKST